MAGLGLPVRFGAGVGVGGEDVVEAVGEEGEEAAEGLNDILRGAFASSLLFLGFGDAMPLAGGAIAPFERFIKTFWFARTIAISLF